MATLYLNGYETDAKLDNRGILVRKLNHETEAIDTMRVPFFDIDRAVVVGRAELTTPLLQKLARENIPIVFLESHGKWLGTLHPTGNGHALRRLRQYDLARNPEFAIRMAKKVISAKIVNSRRVLQRLAANRKEADLPNQQETCNTLLALAEKVETADNLETLRGLEGYASACYFKRLGTFFPEELPFTNRNRRPPKDEANALLSWTYTIVLSEVDGAVHAAGLDPCLGFLHEISYGRPSLSLDLLEPLRAPLCDMLALRLFNHHLLKKEDFEFRSDEGGIYLKQEARKAFFVEYERTMTRRFAKSRNEAHTDFRSVCRTQVNSLLRAMEGDEDPDFFRMP